MPEQKDEEIKQEEKEEKQTGLAGMSDEDRKEIVEKWNKRFKKSKDFITPYREKWLRMYKLYRAYRDESKYAYQTNLLPPIAFEVVETVKPRLSAAKINVRIIPREKNDINSESLNAWDDLIKYDFDVTTFSDTKIDWINSTLQFGDGILGLVWKNSKDEKNDGDPFMWVQDLWLFFPDPEATDLQKDSRYEIILSYKTKSELEKEESERGESKIYLNLENVSDKMITDDPRKERYSINTKKMGQIATGKAGEGTETDDKMADVKKLELLQIWDHEYDRLIVIANQTELIRYEDNPYKPINKGRIFIQLSDHSVLWDLWSIGHIEPIETTINELADSRNQAMDDIVFTLDPIRKVRKDSHIKADDIVYAPGAVWELKRADDVVTERPPEVSREWIAKDEILRKEIQSSLAISEYAMGMPQGKQEAMGKVQLLLMQTNIRFSVLVRQLETAITKLVNNLIELNQEFLTEEKSYRLVGKEVAFKDFKDEDKKVIVDAIVDIEPQVEKTPDQRKDEIFMLYKIFIAEDKPDANDLNEVERWKVRKKVLQKMILEACDKEQYEELILGLEDQKEKVEEKVVEPAPIPSAVQPGGVPVVPQGQTQPIALIPRMGGQGEAVPQSPPGEALGAKIPFLKRIINKIKGRATK